MTDFCFCGHTKRRHLYKQPASTFVVGFPDPELVFTHCAGMAPHGDEKPVCVCKGFQLFPLGVYRHLKTGNLYEATSLGFNSEDRTVEVEYTSIQHGERWHRPIYTPTRILTAQAMGRNEKLRGFLESTEDGRPRFEFVSGGQ